MRTSLYWMLVILLPCIESKRKHVNLQDSRGDLEPMERAVGDDAGGGDTNQFGDLRMLSREYRRQYVVEDPMTPIYGLVRTPCYPLNSTNVYSRLGRNFRRSPALLLALLAALACLAWTCAAIGISFCFGHRYRCALCLGDGTMCKTCLHFWMCCFICHFCLNRGKGNGEFKKEKKCQEERSIPDFSLCSNESSIMR